MEKAEYDYYLINSAYHEASHALLAIFNYIYVISAKLETKDSREGTVYFYTYEHDMTDEEISRILDIFEIQVMYAGSIGERKFYKKMCGSEKFPKYLKQTSSYDFQIASKIIRKNNLAEPGKKTYILKKQTQRLVDNILEENWDAIELLSYSLYKKKRLSFDDIKNILTKKTKNKEMWREKFKKIKLIYSNKEIEVDFIKDLFQNNI